MFPGNPRLAAGYRWTLKCIPIPTSKNREKIIGAYIVERQ